MKKFHRYFEFAKVEPLDDGTVRVAGIASSEAVDSYGEIITAEAMRDAIPDYMRFGAVREMHQEWAAGTALRCEVDEAGRTQFEAVVVDSEAVRKVLAGVYKGFSVGGRVLARDKDNPNIITKIQLIEVSLVDRPANPEAVFSIVRMEGADRVSLGDLRRGMSEVAGFAQLLQALAWLASSLEAESELEGDASPLPSAISAWVAQGAELLQAMTAEEVQELVASLPKAPAPAAEESAEAGEEVEALSKAGARFSRATRAALAEIHQAIRECDQKLAALGYDADEEDEEDEEDDAEDSAKAAVAEQLAKAQAEQQDAAERLKKAQAEAERLAGELEAAKARIAELEARPEPPRGPLMSISKGEDVVAGPAERDLRDVAAKLSQLPPQHQALELIRIIHGGSRA